MGYENAPLSITKPLPLGKSSGQRLELAEGHCSNLLLEIIADFKAGVKRFSLNAEKSDYQFTRRIKQFSAKVMYNARAVGFGKPPVGEYLFFGLGVYYVAEDYIIFF